MYSQSYPIQRVEGSDTVVVLTKQQAAAMNLKFLQMKQQIDLLGRDYSDLMAVADSLATLNIRSEARLRWEKENALKAKKHNNGELLARTIFLTWVYFTLTIING